MTHDPGRVSHVLYCFEPDDLERAAEFWRTTFGVVFQEVDVPGTGLRILFSLDSGLELVAPTGDVARPQYRAFLDATGGGVYGIVYAVPDVDAAAGRAAEGGVATTARLSYTGRAPWSEEYDVLEEAILEEHVGMRVVIAQIERKATPT